MVKLSLVHTVLTCQLAGQYFIDIHCVQSDASKCTSIVQADIIPSNLQPARAS